MTTTMSPPVQRSAKRHLGLAILSLAMGGFAIGTTEFAMMGLLKEVEEGLAIRTPEAGNLISAYALGVVIGAPVFAAFGAKLPRKHLALGLMLFLSVANLTSFIAPDYGLMLVSRFASGLPHGAFFGVAAVIAASLVAPTKRGWAISMVMAGLTVSNVIGVPLATWVGQTFGWRLLFVIVGAIGLGTVAMVWKFVPFEPVHPEASIRRELGALKRLQVWLALLIGIIGFGGFFAVYTYIAHTMTSVAGIPENFIPAVVALYGVGMVVGNIIGGRIADRSVMGTIYFVMPGIAVALVVYAIAANWAWSAFLMAFVVGGIGSMLTPALQTRLLDAAPGAASLASSLNHSALNIANALGAFLGGTVIAWGWGYVAPALVGAVLAVLGLGVAVISGLVERRKPLA
ncbi:MFS transporter [Arthrobacter sp. TES]|uniref:MFS transporter n=1 Tax=Paenarthrobacter ureafaciens TaxID=37931 RepID=A0AAX3EMD7_PAEUR|nr:MULTISPECIES: MFS transporter [Paenarthrobacter]ERI35740.1 arabinose ABC transporter permease [Arthrobacter sp. AK-YN10]NKR12049.1 arabinose ABC transporter permease [Arthrobacter sp. M5]NKR18215.1 arabinose ABC transporter permease [Arthrobacter sp. M6]OEH57389.1 arabinose ABC transporter permease [Arthrobacter sp. D2]OEH65037.1 arabinose ABC transporter permease [Arthrobacter sp. D4]QOI63700.1 MFS transporter [Arthrobacter sp. TES]BCW83751.1 MFS transporter [Arthrobacter sp. NicSoilE8]